jgi:hypothetical protein
VRTATRSAPRPIAVGPGRRRRRDDLGHSLLRARLLLSSYAPLNVILFIRVDSGWRFGFIALALAGFLDANRITWLAKRVAPVRRTFSAVRDSGGEVAAYVATYLLPFLAAPHAGAGEIWAYAIFAAVVAVISLRSDLAHVNPTIYLLGWKVVTVTLQDGRERYLVCRRAPSVGEPVSVTELYGVLQARD